MASTTVPKSAKTASRSTPALVICLVAGFLTLLDVSIVNVALPSMERGLHLSPAQVSWAVAGYALAFGLTLVPAGRLGDEYGRRKLFLIGLVLFAITAVGCGAAPNGLVLVVGRLCRGISAGLIAPQVIGLIQQMYSGPRRGRVFGYYGATVGLSTAVGPLVGGMILQAFGTSMGWRFVFYLSLPVVLVTLAVAFAVLPADRPGRVHHRLDLVGVLLLGLGVLAIMLPLAQATGVGAHPMLWPFGVGIAILVAFVLWERRLAARDSRPLVHLKVLRIRGYAVGAMIATTFYAGFTGIFLVLTLFLQQGLHDSPVQAAMATLIFTIGSAGTAVLSGRIMHRAGPRLMRIGRTLVVAGSGVATAGLAVTALIAHDATRPDAALALAVPLLLTGCGCGLIISANQTLSLNDIPRAHAGVAAGVYETGQRIGTALGTALATTLFFTTLARSQGDYHAAVGVGLISPVVLVGIAFLIGLVDVIRPAPAQTDSMGHAKITHSGHT